MYKIAVTGVGAIIGQGIIRSLRSSTYPVHIIGLDANPRAVGKQFVDTFICCPKATHPNFLEAMPACDLIIPGIPQDALRFASDKNTLSVALDPKYIQLSDKWFVNQKLGNPIPSSQSWSFEELSYQLGTPFLLKPFSGSAGKGIQKIHSQRDFNYWKSYEHFAQKIVGTSEEEYSVSCFGLGDGTLTGQIALKRTLGFGGSTQSAEVIFDDILQETVKDITQCLQPTGPCNYQFRKENNQFKLMDVNPRISSASSIRLAFGYNEAEMCIKYFLEGTIPDSPEIVPGFAQRYVEDICWLSSATCTATTEP